MTGGERNALKKAAELLRVLIATGRNLTSTQAVVLDFVASTMEILTDDDDAVEAGK